MHFPIRDHRPIVSIPMDIYIGREGLGIRSGWLLVTSDW